MPVYAYKAIDQKKNVHAGSMEAPTLEALAAVLKTRGLFLMESRFQALQTPPAVEERPAVHPPASGEEPPIRSIPLDALAIFTSELSVMLRTALPMNEALHTLARQQKNPKFKRVLFQLCRNVQEGKPLSYTFERFPQVFDPVYIALLKSGEASGKVPEMLERLSGYLDFQREMHSKIQAALLYPAIISLTGIGVALFLTLYILPCFAEMFARANAELPLLTQVLLALSRHLQSWWKFYVLAAAGAVWAIRRWLEDPLRARALERAELRLPVVGLLIRNIVMTRILRTLGALVAAGVPILEALKLSGDSASHRVFHDILERVQKSAAEGKGLATTLTGDPFFPAVAADMIANAEMTGKLPEVMTQISIYYERQTDISIRNVFTVMEPVFVVLIGLVVGVIAVSILWPMFRLDGGLQ
jgi:type IV pilus assembly protein PilC